MACWRGQSKKGIVMLGLIVGRVFARLCIFPLLNSPDYNAESAQTLTEIARVHRPMRARHSITRRVIIEHLHYDYQFRSLLWGRILTFNDLMEAGECCARVERMDESIKKGFIFFSLWPTMVLARVSGRHWL